MIKLPSFKEDHISQIPALQFLQNMGYNYLSPDEAMSQRGSKTTIVLLEGILRAQLEKINTIRYKGNSFGFSPSNIQSGIQALKDLPMQEGYISACSYVYDLITLGKALEQNIDGDKKSYTLQYIDWEHPQNNVFHVTEEYSVMRSGSHEHYRPDLVLFINGIPICIIECKRPDLKEPIKQAISQHLRSQQENGIRNLYVYAQTLLSISSNKALFATNGAEEDFWFNWEEKFSNKKDAEEYRNTLFRLKNTPLSKENKDRLFSDKFRYVRRYFDDLEKNDIMPVIQDEYLYGLCRPERLLDLIFNFIIFDAGIKKIARYPQFFALKKTMERVKVFENGKRKGGVIWHTQGSGKSLTMVMLAQAIALDRNIKNPKIILVTDRIDLDDQITGTFRKCGKTVDNASTGEKLAKLLQSSSDAVITTVINKFEKAVRNVKQPFTSPEIFVLVDEGHRTQYGDFNIQMMKTLPNACFIAMTGTPLMRKEKNTAAKFGGIIDTYTVDKAVEDGAVVPLLYEGRHAFQTVNENPIDNYFLKISESLTPYQKVDLKKKYSRADQLNSADQKIYAIAWDLSYHFRDNFQGTGLKGQLVCQKKEDAIKYKNYLDEIGIVSSEVLISPPDEREGEESAYGESSDTVKTFWKKMMDEHGTPKKYDKNIINRFKHLPDPEILIVVDKCLTGFDAPRNTVLYLTRKLLNHTLLQAIARVNRVYPGKDFGYIIDYYGVLSELNSALELYSELYDYDKDDLSGIMKSINDEIRSLPQRHSELWDIFKIIKNKKDVEAFEFLLRDEALRVQFYDKLTSYARCLKVALSSIQFHKDSTEQQIEHYKDSLAFFIGLRSSVMQRYSDKIDYSQYEGQIQKLIDKHVQTETIKPITKLVNIFDKEEFHQELENTKGSAAKADKIATRTAKYITTKMDEDPAFYKKFSEMIKETIRAFEEHRISEAEYLNMNVNMMDAVLSHTDKDIPDELRHHDAARAFFGVIIEAFGSKFQDEDQKRQTAIATALTADDIIRKHVFDGNKLIIDWKEKSNITGRIQIEIGDFIIDEVKEKHNADLSFDEIDIIAEHCLNVAKARYK